jgi:hypothetical protein
MKFLRKMAGFSAHAGSYFVPRSHVEVPPVLLTKVFPWLAAWEVRFRQRQKKKNWAQGGLDKQDLAGQSFVDFLAVLRKVLLQDLAVLQPSEYLYNTSILQHFTFLGEHKNGVLLGLL